MKDTAREDLKARLNLLLLCEPVTPWKLSYGRAPVILFPLQKSSTCKAQFSDLQKNESCGVLHCSSANTESLRKDEDDRKNLKGYEILKKLQMSSWQDVAI